MDLQYFGKSKNKLQPDPDAIGPHSTFKGDPNTRKITNYETYEVNPKNPTGFDTKLRYDGIGTPHYNKKTGEELLPHVHDKNAPGGVRKPYPYEKP